MELREVPGRYWLVLGTLLISLVLAPFWDDGMLVAGVGMILGVGMTALDVGWWPAKRFVEPVRVSTRSMDEECRSQGTRKDAVTEYCIMQESCSGIHRGPWSEEDCLDWLQEAEDDGVRPGAFYIATRAVTEWKKGY